MKTFIKIVVALVVIIGIGLFFIGRDGTQNTDNNVVEEHPLIHVSTPVKDALVTSPLKVSGEARGNWYFEASFPVRLYDGNGKEISVDIAQAQGDWMTTEFVPFEMKLIFANPTTTTGTLVLQKDNPSGLAEHDDSLRIPVRFEPSTTDLQDIKLYYYNEFNDKDAQGNVMCSSKGLEAIRRQIPVTMSPLRETLNLFLKGELSNLEQGQGISTEYSTLGLKLKDVTLSKTGVADITFVEPFNMGGGSCRMSILKAQIEATAKQFSTVKSVRFPQDPFQP